MEKFSWTDRVRNELLYIVEEKRRELNTIKWRKADWNVHILSTTCLLKNAIKKKTKRK